MSEHELWNELGNLYFLSGAYAQAVHAYNRSIQLDEGFGRPYSNLALTHVQQGRFDQAVDLYRRSIELLAENKEKAISWNRLGNVYRYLKDYGQAVVAYRHADELDPDNSETEEQPGWAADPDGDAQAGSRVRAAAPPESRHPDSLEIVQPQSAPVPQSAAAASASSNGTWELAQSAVYQQDVSEALEPGSLTTWGQPDVEPDWPPDPETEIGFPESEGDDVSKWLPIPEAVPQDLIEVSMAEEQLDAGEEGFGDEVYAPMPDVTIEPAGADETNSPAQVDLPAGATIVAVLPPKSNARIDSVEPVQSVRNVALDIIVEERAAPEYVVASADQVQPAEAMPAAPTAGAVAEAQTAIQSTEAAGPQRDDEDVREFEAGIAKFKRVVQLNPRNAHAWDALGNLYKSAGLYREALMAYEQAISNDPSKAMYHHHLGLVYACEGRTEDAIDAFQRVLEIDPDHSLAHATLGGYYRKMGLEELAQKHVGKVMKSIFDSENEYNRACLAAICGNTDQALELLREALKNKQTYVDWILRDPDLDFIRQDPRFKQLVSDYAR